MRLLLLFQKAKADAQRDRLDPVWETHRAAVLKGAVGEATVAFTPELDLIGALEEQGLLKVASLLVHVGYAVLAVIGDVLGGLGGHQAQEGQLDSNIGGVGALASISKLQGQREGGGRLSGHVDLLVPGFPTQDSCILDLYLLFH